MVIAQDAFSQRMVGRQFLSRRHAPTSQTEKSMNGSRKPANGLAAARGFSVHPKLFVFFDKRTGTPRFQVRACQDGTLPIDQATPSAGGLPRFTLCVNSIALDRLGAFLHRRAQDSTVEITKFSCQESGRGLVCRSD